MGSFYEKEPLENPKFIKHNRVLRKLDNYYNRYWNLETTTPLFVEKKDISTFEKGNNIIKFIVPIDIRDEFIYHDKFYEIRREYFKILTYTTQEQAISKIKVRTRNHKKDKILKIIFYINNEKI